MKTFEQALREQLEQSPKRRFRGKRLLALLDAPPSDRRTRVLARLERYAVARLEDDGVTVPVVQYTDPDGTVAEGRDWSQVDWAKVFEIVLKFLLVLLPLFV